MDRRQGGRRQRARPGGGRLSFWTAITPKEYRLKLGKTALVWVPAAKLAPWTRERALRCAALMIGIFGLLAVGGLLGQVAPALMANPNVLAVVIGSLLLDAAIFLGVHYLLGWVALAFRGHFVADPSAPSSQDAPTQEGGGSPW